MAAQGAQAAHEAPGDVIQMGRIYHDPAVPELVCRYPGEPTVTLMSKSPREVVVELNGKPVRVSVRNGVRARIGGHYLMIRDGDDQGLWLLIEPGDTLE